MDISEITSFKVEPEWRHLEIEGMEDAEFLIAPVTSKAFRLKQNKLNGTDSQLRRGRTKIPSREKLEDCTRDAIPGTLLLDWKGLEDNGKPYDYSDERAEFLLKHSRIFWEEIITISTEMSQERHEISEEAKENLGK